VKSISPTKEEYKENTSYRIGSQFHFKIYTYFYYNIHYYTLKVYTDPCEIGPPVIYSICLECKFNHRGKKRGNYENILYLKGGVMKKNILKERGAMKNLPRV
jgi:ribosome biogenesis protein Nip4